ncbi:hypothetical protein [Novosphingobium sp. BL-52-GroH]|uniref:hypothetical protein n=1 Tax=Novosphingobium sp. BL-52-GroH TaxID=3349877 RepID=UPI00384FA4E9
MAGLIAHAGKLVLRFGPTTAVLLLSQAVSALSLFMLPLLGLRVSDVYAIAVQTGTGPYNGLVLGVIYLMVIGRPNFDRWKLVYFAVVAFAIVLTAYSLVSALKRSADHALPMGQTAWIVLLFGGGSIALGIASVRGVRQACLGRPWLLAGVTMGPNLGMALTTGALHFGFAGLAFAPVLPAAAWSLVAFVIAVVFVALPLPVNNAAQNKHAPEPARNKFLHALGLVVGLVTSTILPIGFVTAAGNLSAGSATVLFLANRIGSAIVGVFVNAVLMVRINWEDTERLYGRYSFAFPLISNLMVLAAALWNHLGGQQTISYAIVALAWLSLTSSTPIVLREANVRRLGSVIMTKALIDLAVSSLALLYFQRWPSATGYFGAAMISQSITCIVCGWAFHDRRLVGVSLPGLALAILLLIRGW